MTPAGLLPKGPLAKQKVRLLARLAEMALSGPPRNTEVCHQIEGSLWQIEQGQIRVLWFYDEGRIVVLSHGFVKRTQKTPDSEKRVAREALWCYREAKAKGRLRIQEDP